MFQLLLSQLLVSHSKLSGSKKLTLRYQLFGVNFDFEISRVDCILIKLLILHAVKPTNLFGCKTGSSPLQNDNK